MKQWKVTVKGNDGFSMTRNAKAVKVEDAINEVIQLALKVTIEDIVQVQAIRES